MFFKKTKIWAIRAGIVFMQIKYNDPGTILSLQTFVHTIIQFFGNLDSFRSLLSECEYNVLAISGISPNLTNSERL